MAKENPTWGEERIANELMLKLGLVLSPRTVGKYMPKNLDGSSKNKDKEQTWSTFIKNNLDQMLACDFFTVFSIGFKTLYVFVLMELGSRKVLHFNVTTNPNPQWIKNQFKGALPLDHDYKYIIHDGNCNFSADVDHVLETSGLEVIKTAPRSPKQNAFVERLNGTFRRECVDYLIPLNENHLRGKLKKWVTHYNTGRPHMSLGPGIPEPPDHIPIARQKYRHQLLTDFKVVSKPILGGLHHEYSLTEAA